ncbi:MAG: histidine ammonia-lyase [Candidatus Eisenbacteria bacterium]|nr:histidine ammonia-lyase [Candidatus Eisenbacteria bacterium]
MLLDGNSLTIDQVHEVARNHAEVGLSPSARKAVKKCRSVAERLMSEGQLIYGVTTGIGELSRVAVSPEQGEELQKRIIRSHSAGVGEHFAEDCVRAAMLLRANVLARGYSAVRLELLETLVGMLNRGVVPAVNKKGSVGTSGDLTSLAQIGCVLMGEGEAYYGGKLMSGKAAMRKAGLAPVKLSFKEGLALINGSQFFTGCGALCAYDADRIIRNAIIASAMSADALRTPLTPFDARIHKLRPFVGQIVVAQNMRRLLKGSQLIKEGSDKVQDAYSIRCIPQVYSPSIDALQYVRQQIEIEMNSVTDNPLFFPEEGVQLSCGNFHGQQIAMALDYLCIAMSEIGALSERHINRLVNPHLSGGLPAFLVESEGLNSGYMLAHYTATALCSENKVLSHPAVVDNFSMAADQEDTVSMGPIAASKLDEINTNVVNVVAIEMMCAAQAFDLLEHRPGKGTAVAHESVRSVVPTYLKDRIVAPDIEKIAQLIRSWELLEAVEREVGPVRLTLRGKGRVRQRTEFRAL